MTTLDDLLDVGDKRRNQTRHARQLTAGYLCVGLWSTGWALAKLLNLLLAVVAGVFFSIGWCCARVAPMLKWAGTAFMLGWEAGRPAGGTKT